MRKKEKKADENSLTGKHHADFFQHVTLIDQGVYLALQIDF